MYTQISSKKRLTALLVAFAFLLGTFAVGTETVSAASQLKVSPTRKTVYIGSDKENPHHRSQQGSDKDQCGQHGDRNRCGQSLHR